MKENSLLIEEMTRVKKMNNEYLQQIKTLKFQYSTVTNELNKLKKNNNIQQVNNNNQINMLQNGNISIINNNSLYTNISTNPSEMLPMLTYGFPFNSSKKADLKNMKNRIFKPGNNLTIPNERILKFNEMKKIIEGKNDIIQRLSVENDFLKHSLTTNRSKLSTSPMPSNKLSSKL